MITNAGFFMIKDSIPYAHPLFFFWAFIVFFIVFRKGFYENSRLKREFELEKIKFEILREIEQKSLKSREILKYCFS